VGERAEATDVETCVQERPSAGSGRSDLEARLTKTVKGAGLLKNFRCHQDRVLVEFEDDPRQTKGGIILPEAKKPRRSTKGRIVAIGPECPQHFKVGTLVWVLLHAGADVVLETDETERAIGEATTEFRYRVLSHHEIFGWWEE
jgi:co-chaperonin GroES (HSP10)